MKLPISNSMYPREMTDPMERELTSLGVKALKTQEEVDLALNANDPTLVVVNSVCGCAAGNARPSIKLALKHSKLPKQKVTVFAGVDREATERARSYFTGYQHSSPMIALLKNKKVVFALERYQIEDKKPEEIASQLTKTFDTYCQKRPLV